MSLVNAMRVSHLHDLKAKMENSVVQTLAQLDQFSRKMEHAPTALLIKKPTMTGRHVAQISAGMDRNSPNLVHASTVGSTSKLLRTVKVVCKNGVNQMNI